MYIRKKGKYYQQQQLFNGEKYRLIIRYAKSGQNLYYAVTTIINEANEYVATKILVRW